MILTARTTKAAGETPGVAPPHDPDVPLAGGGAIPNPIHSACLAQADHPALVAQGQTWSAADLLDAVTRAAGALRGAGVGPGVVVALCGPPSAEWVVTFHALGWLGATAAPLPPRATPEEHARALAALEPDLLLLTHGLPSELRRALQAQGGRFPSELPPGPPPPERAWPLDEVRVRVLTSGSTGAPRPVPLTTLQVLLSCFGSAVRLGHDPQDRWLCCLPLHHVGGLMILLRCAFYGTTVLLQERFDPQRVARALDAGEASQVSLVPAMLERVLEARPALPFPPRLRAILLGGDACPPALLERCRALGAPVAITWGMTEAGSQLCTRRPGDLTPEGGCGAPLPFVRVRAQEGRLVVEGPLVSAGEGRLVTRDLGAVERGVVHVHGRLEDALISGGETLAVGEVEAVLREHPALADVAVLPLPDARWGERPAALVVPRPGCEAPGAEALRAWCGERLSDWKVPERVVACAAIPRGELGKLHRPAALSLLGASAAAPARDPLAQTSPSAAGTSAAGPSANGPSANGTDEWAPAPAPGRKPASAGRGQVEALGVLEQAAARAGSSAAARLGALRAWLAEDLDGLEAAIEALAGPRQQDQPPEEGRVRRAGRHLLLQPGKRLRPLCLLLAARLLPPGEGAPPAIDPGAARDLAVACELVHAATLLHDDVIDEGTERRGAPTARVVYGNTASVLAGDALLVEALRLVGRAGIAGLLESLLGVIAEMVDAEALQLERRGRADPSREAYLAVIRGKTAALFRWALMAGGAAGGLPERLRDALQRAGASLGLAFQLVDDLLDLQGDPLTTGKDALADLRQGKLTWPLIVAAERDPELRRSLEALVSAGEDGALERLVERVEATGAVEATRTLARAHAEAARAALAELPLSPARVALEGLMEAAVERIA